MLGEDKGRLLVSCDQTIRGGKETIICLEKEIVIDVGGEHGAYNWFIRYRDFLKELGKGKPHNDIGGY